MKAIVLGAALLAFGGFSGADAAEPVTHQEIIDLPLDKLGPRITDQLSEVLEARRERDWAGGEPRSVYLHTKAYPIGSQFCRVDALYPIFSPPYQARMSIDPARPSTAVGFDVKHYFKKVREGQDCSDAPGLYQAPSTEVALNGYKVLETAIRQAPDKGFPVNCGGRDASACAAELASMKVELLKSVFACEAMGPAPASSWARSCYQFVAGNQAVRIEFEARYPVARILSTQMLLMVVAD